MKTPVITFTLTMALALGSAAFAQESALDPQLPFKSCKLTFKPMKSGTIEAELVVYIKGSNSIGIVRQTQNGKPDETVYRGTDGVWVFDVTLDGSGAVTEAKREHHPAFFLRADLAGLNAGEKKKLAENLPILWRKFAPAFNVDDWGVRAELAVTGREKVAGRDCELCEYKGGGPARRLWRWEGTNLILKQQIAGYVTEVATIEENVDIPDSVFALPGNTSWEVQYGDFDRSQAMEIFKALVGREATAEPDREPDSGADGGEASTITLEGKTYTLPFVSLWLSPEDGEFGLDSGGEPYLSASVHGVAAKRAVDLSGKQFTLGSFDDSDASTLGINVSDSLQYQSKKGVLKVVSVQDGVAVIEVSGTFTRFAGDDEKDVQIGTITFRAQVSE